MKSGKEKNNSKVIEVDFSAEKTAKDDIYLEDMNAEQLREYIAALRQQLSELDALEPADEESEEYEDWADEHEELEDVIDEALDRLDEING